jgi:hypothetical protein
MIKDLFSHKIHSSGDEWPEKLAELAAIFGEFDGHLYDRSAFEERLRRISPRSSYLAADAAASTQSGTPRDVSKFRDEISAYPAYLGLYFLEKTVGGWIVKVSETAKRFLLKEEPDVGSFLRLQLPLLQHPNGKGARYESRGATLQDNVARTTLTLIQEGIHLSPLRLVTAAIKADATLRDVDVLQGNITPREVFGLANAPEVNKMAAPNQAKVIDALHKIRSGLITLPDGIESRFHTLLHTEMFARSRHGIGLREAVNEADAAQLLRRLDAICSIENQFNDLDHCTTRQDIEAVINAGAWGRYFDGVKVLPAWIVDELTGDKVMEMAEVALPDHEVTQVVIPSPAAETYPLRVRTSTPQPPMPYSRSREIADPEVTRIKRQRRNLAHKELIDKMAEWLKCLGAQPKENDHIDLFAKIPHDGSFIFEMKSGGDSLLEQIRKGLSQLYEYRYRYRAVINDDQISLCLVLPESPDVIPWITDYLCDDRKINICWFNEDDELEWPSHCAQQMQVLKVKAAHA